MNRLLCMLTEYVNPEYARGSHLWCREYALDGKKVIDAKYLSPMQAMRDGWKLISVAVRDGHVCWYLSKD